MTKWFRRNNSSLWLKDDEATCACLQTSTKLIEIATKLCCLTLDWRKKFSVGCTQIRFHFAHTWICCKGTHVQEIVRTGNRVLETNCPKYCMRRVGQLGWKTGAQRVHHPSGWGKLGWLQIARIMRHLPEKRRSWKHRKMGRRNEDSCKYEKTMEGIAKINANGSFY